MFGSSGTKKFIPEKTDMAKEYDDALWQFSNPMSHAWAVAELVAETGRGGRVADWSELRTDMLEMVRFIPEAPGVPFVLDRHGKDDGGVWKAAHELTEAVRVPPWAHTKKPAPAGAGAGETSG